MRRALKCLACVDEISCGFNIALTALAQYTFTSKPASTSSIPVPLPRSPTHIFHAFFARPLLAAEDANSTAPVLLLTAHDLVKDRNDRLLKQSISNHCGKGQRPRGPIHETVMGPARRSRGPLRRGTTIDGCLEPKTPTPS